MIDGQKINVARFDFKNMVGARTLNPPSLITSGGTHLPGHGGQSRRQPALWSVGPEQPSKFSAFSRTLWTQGQKKECFGRMNGRDRDALAGEDKRLLPKAAQCKVAADYRCFLTLPCPSHKSMVA